MKSIFKLVNFSMAEMSISHKQMPSYYKRKKIILLSLSTSMISLEHIITPQGLERITSQACKWMSTTLLSRSFSLQHHLIACLEVIHNAKKKSGFLVLTNLL